MKNNKNNIEKKLRKLNLDEFEYFFNMIKNHRDGN